MKVSAGCPAALSLPLSLEVSARTPLGGGIQRLGLWVLLALSPKFVGGSSGSFVCVLFFLFSCLGLHFLDARSKAQVVVEVGAEPGGRVISCTNTYTHAHVHVHARAHMHQAEVELAPSSTTPPPNLQPPDGVGVCLIRPQ